MKKMILLMMTLGIMLSCSTEESQSDIITADAKANVGKSRDIVLSATVEGTIEEQLASMVVVSSHKKPTRLKWTVNEEQVYHVVIRDKDLRWLVQTHVSGKEGFYIGGYIVNREPNDGNIHIVKGEQYYLYFTVNDILVPFVIE